jgi:hypothetical protein
MVCHPATRRERNEREKSVPNKPYPVEISTEGMRKHGTPISPHKPILCWDLCGRGACFAVTIPMDHPSSEGHFPSQVDSVHGDTVPYGWENVDRAWLSPLPISPQSYRCQLHESLPDKTRRSPSPEDAGMPISVLNVLLSFLPAFRSCEHALYVEQNCSVFQLIT